MASRRVVLISAVVMIVASLIGKWMAVLIMIPEPVVGGLLIVLCGESIASIHTSASTERSLLNFCLILKLYTKILENT